VDFRTLRREVLGVGWRIVCGDGYCSGSSEHLLGLAWEDNTECLGYKDVVGS